MESFRYGIECSMCVITDKTLYMQTKQKKIGTRGIYDVNENVKEKCRYTQGLIIC